MIRQTHEGEIGNVTQYFPSFSYFRHMEVTFNHSYTVINILEMSNSSMCTGRLFINLTRHAGKSGASPQDAPAAREQSRGYGTSIRTTTTGVPQRTLNKLRREQFPVSRFFDVIAKFSACQVVTIVQCLDVLIDRRYPVRLKSPDDMMTHLPYRLKPLRLGAEVFGIDLAQPQEQSVIEQIKRDVTTHRLLICRKQSPISGARHVEISRWFGELESTFYKHPKSPHPDIFRVSNDSEEGCRGVGRTGWHIDGSFQPAPFSHSLYYMHVVPKQGDTVFAPLHEIVAGLPSSQLDRWERLYMVSDRRGGVAHPLVYSHPMTGKKTLCFHLGMTEAFLMDCGKDGQRLTDPEETRQILDEIHHEFVKDGGIIQYSHKWEVGDFLISDNLAVGHEATPETQRPVCEVGLRVLHRTTVKGTERPTKHYDITVPPNT